MRLLCFLAVQPALSQPAMITQWLPNCYSWNIKHTHEHTKSHTGCVNVLKLFLYGGDGGGFHEKRRHQQPLAQPPLDLSSVNEAIGSQIWCSMARSSKWRNSLEHLHTNYNLWIKWIENLLHKLTSDVLRGMEDCDNISIAGWGHILHRQVSKRGCKIISCHHTN